MTIAGKEIPQAKIDKLSGLKKHLLYVLYEASPGAITTRTLYNAAGTGAPSRMKELNEDFLDLYGLIIHGQRWDNIKGREVWAYWIAERDRLPIMPKTVHGDY